MDAPDLEVMGPLSPGLIISGVFRVRLGSVQIQTQVQASRDSGGKEPAIVRVKGVGWVVSVRGLRLIGLTCPSSRRYCTVSARSPMLTVNVRWRPLILNQNSCRPPMSRLSPPGVITPPVGFPTPSSGKVNIWLMVDRPGPIDLKPSFDQVFLAVNIGVIQPHATGIAHVQS